MSPCFHRRAILALGLVFLCLLPGTWAADKPRIALVIKATGNPFFVQMTDGARSHQASHAADYDLSISGIEKETDAVGQIRLVERAIAAKVDALLLAPADSRELVPVVKRAIAAGILVVNIDNKLDDRVLAEQGINVPFVGPSNRQGARLVGDYLGKTLRAGDEVAIIEGISTTVNAQARTSGFREAMTAIGANLVAVQSGLWETEKARLVAMGLLAKYPNLKAFLCGNDNMALGALAAVRAANRSGSVKVVGYDNIAGVRPLLQDGQMLATIDQFPEQQVIFGVELVLKALHEKSAQAVLPAVVQTPVKLVTK